MQDMTTKNAFQFLSKRLQRKAYRKNVQQPPFSATSEGSKGRALHVPIRLLTGSPVKIVRSLRGHSVKAHLRIWLLIVVMAVLCIPKSSHQQTTMNKTLLQGIEEFYSARFEDAIKSLQEVSTSLLSSQDDLFAAHVYLAFCYIRQGADEATIRQHFLAAVQANSSIELDPNRIPPDLFEQFEAVRNTLVGGLIVQSTPPEATAILVEPETGRQINKDVPASFPHLLQGTYSLIISKPGYKLQTTNVKVRSGATDTVLVTLARKKPAFYTRWWAWGGGLAFATAMLIYGAGEEQGKEKVQSDLPGPPARP